MATQQATLTPNEPLVPVNAYRSVAIHGDFAAVSDPYRKTKFGQQAGAVYVYRRSSGGWAQEAELLGWDIKPGDWFGSAVAISNDMLVVGAPGHGESEFRNNGAVFCYTRSGDTWIEQGYLQPPAGSIQFGRVLAMDSGTLLVSTYTSGPSQVLAYRRDGMSWVPNGLMVGDYDEESGRDGLFGDSVACSADTALAIVGAPTGGTYFDGSAYVFRYVPSVGWLRDAKLEPAATFPSVHPLFGQSVAISGLRALVGAPLTEAAGAAVGAVYVIEGQGVEWVRSQTLFAGDPAIGDYFGGSVALTSTRALVGAPGDDLSDGGPAWSAYVFELAAATGRWTETAKISKLASPETAPEGQQIALSGESFMMSLPSIPAHKAASIYRKSGAAWSEEASLAPREGSRFDRFGSSVSICADLLAVGAPADDPGDAEDSGAVYVYERTSTTWTQHERLTAPTPVPRTQAGFAVALCGDILLAGCPPQLNIGPAESGHVLVFRRASTSWEFEATLLPSDSAPQQFGCAVAISGDTAVIGARHADTARGAKTGAAYIFVRHAGQWTQQAQLVGSDVGEYDNSASAVAFDGQTVAVGNPGHGPGSGAVYVFVRSGSTWSEQAILRTTSAAAQDRLGYSVAVSGDRIVAGAPGRPFPTPRTSGYATVFGRLGTAWSEHARLIPPSPQTFGRFGTSVAITEDGRVLVGDPVARKAYLLALIHDSWQQKDVLDGVLAGSFGSSICTSASTGVIGAPSAATPIGPSGATLVFSLA